MKLSGVDKLLIGVFVVTFIFAIFIWVFTYKVMKQVGDIIEERGAKAIFEEFWEGPSKDNSLEEPAKGGTPMEHY